MNKSPFAINLNNARKRWGHTYMGAARHVGIPEPRIRSYLDGRAHPTLPMFLKIARFYLLTDLEAFIEDPTYVSGLVDYP